MPKNDNQQTSSVVLLETVGFYDVWTVRPGETLSMSRWHLVVMGAFVFLGAIIGPLGTFSLPEGLGVSSLWPAMAIQAVGGIWFGGWGMLAAAVFPMLSNWVIGGSAANIFGFIPANLVQGGLAAWYFRRYRIDPRLRWSRDYWAFIVVACVLSNLGGALLGTAALAISGEVKSISRWATLVFSWVTGNGVCCLVFGLPLLKVLSPIVVKSNLFCKTMWRSNAAGLSPPKRLADMPILLKLLSGFLFAGIVPLLLVAGMTIRQIRTSAEHEIANTSVHLASDLAREVEHFLEGRAALLTEAAVQLSHIPPDKAREGRLADFERRHPEFSDLRLVRAPEIPDWARSQNLEVLLRLNEDSWVLRSPDSLGLGRALIAARSGGQTWLLASLLLRPTSRRLRSLLRESHAAWYVLTKDGTTFLSSSSGSEAGDEKLRRLSLSLRAEEWVTEGDSLVALAESASSSVRAIVASPLREAFAGQVSRGKNFLALLVTAGIFAALIVGGFIAQHIDQPIEMLIYAARRIGAGDLDTRVELPAKDEIGELAQTLNQMSSDLRDHIAQLRRTTSEKERMERELEIAADLQRGLLPTDAPDLPTVEVAGMSLPARQAGGDFFDHFLLPPSSLAIAFGDASGKGLPAALFAARAHGAARAIADYAQDASVLVSKINHLLVEEIGAQGFFVTFFFGQLDLEQLTLRCANAGHDPVIVLRAESASVEFIESSAPPLGAWEDSEYELREVHFEPGDSLVIYSDGVTDALSPTGERFGRERLVEAVVANRGKSARDMSQSIHRATEVFARGTTQPDDLTILVIRFK